MKFSIGGKIKVTCDAPLCSRTVEVDSVKYLVDRFKNFLKFGNFKASYFCPEHQERITAGKFDDGDPNTNPDLNINKK
jgi:hypothetical protein